MDKILNKLYKIGLRFGLQPDKVQHILGGMLVYSACAVLCAATGIALWWAFGITAIVAAGREYANYVDPNSKIGNKVYDFHEKFGIPLANTGWDNKDLLATVALPFLLSFVL